MVKMNEYLIRKATTKDIPFLADVIIASKKGMSNNLNLSTLFNIPECEVKTLVKAMLKEKSDGCELSLSSFMVTEYKGEVISGSGTWIEAFDGCLPSGIIKSNLINFTFNKENIEFLKSKSHIIKDILIPREPMTLQLEYFHIVKEHLGKGLNVPLMRSIEEKAVAIYPALKKAQCQIFKNSIFSIKILMKHGYKIVKTHKSNNREIFDYLPFNEKYLMEKCF